MRQSYVLMAPLLLLLVASCEARSSAQDAMNEPSTSAPLTGGACPITQPNGNSPPKEQPSPRYFGDGSIWTMLWPEGKVLLDPSLPGQVSSDGSLSIKWPWWRGLPGRIQIQGRKLDGGGRGTLRTVIPDGYGDSGFQPSTLIFSSEGCWEVTVRQGNHTLSFVTEVLIGVPPTLAPNTSSRSNLAQ